MAFHETRKPNSKEAAEKRDGIQNGRTALLAVRLTGLIARIYKDSTKKKPNNPVNQWGHEQMVLER